MPRTHPLYGNRSKTHDDSVKLSHRSNGFSNLLKPSPASSIATSSSSSSLTTSYPPHRLQDNLHWRCSTCKSLVTTSETGAHLIGCLIDLVAPYIESGHLTNSTDSPTDSLKINQMHSAKTVPTIQRRSSDRPRTKKLERPTPNIKHPVINETRLEGDDDDDSSIGNGISVKSGSCSCRKLINAGPIKTIPENGTNPLETSKCNLNHRIINKASSNRSVSGWSGGSGRVYPPPPPFHPTASLSTASTIKPETTKKVCNTCDRSSAPERLHSHHSKSSHNHQHHHHNSNNSRVNVSPTKATIKETNNNNRSSKSPSVISSQRASPKVEINNISNLKSTVNGEKSPIVNDGQLEGGDDDDNDDNGDKDDENGRNQSNLLDDLDPSESSDQSNYLYHQMKCYLCRQEFDTDEIEIHEIDCLEKWKHDHSVLSPNQRVVITSNQGGVGSGTGDGHRGSFSSITGCDPAGWEHFKSQLTPCPKCGRTFFPHRLAAHEKACLGPQAGKRSKNGPGQTRDNVHPVPGKDKAQLNQYSKCTKKPVPSHQRVHL